MDYQALYAEMDKEYPGDLTLVFNNGGLRGCRKFAGRDKLVESICKEAGIPKGFSGRVVIPYVQFLGGPQFFMAKVEPFVQNGSSAYRFERDDFLQAVAKYTRQRLHSPSTWKSTRQFLFEELPDVLAAIEGAPAN